MQVLVVEDEPLIRLSICELLEDAGFACVEAASAREALALLDAGLRPTVLMTDYNLGPGLNGMALANAAMDRLPGLAVVHVTANADCLLEHALRPYERVMAKPFQAEALVRTVQAMTRLLEAGGFHPAARAGVALAC